MDRNKLQALQKARGLDALIQIADLLDDPQKRNEVLPVLKAFCTQHRAYRERVVGCLLTFKVNISQEEADRMINSRDGDEIFLLARTISRRSDICQQTRTAIICAGEDYKELIIDTLY